jgi:hypothetical protein
LHEQRPRRTRGEKLVNLLQFSIRHQCSEERETCRRRDFERTGFEGHETVVIDPEKSNRIAIPLFSGRMTWPVRREASYIRKRELRPGMSGESREAWFANRI